MSASTKRRLRALERNHRPEGTATDSAVLLSHATPAERSWLVRQRERRSGESWSAYLATLPVDDLRQWRQLLLNLRARADAAK